MVIIGRLTKDAVVNQLKDGRKVVNFTVAVNDYYKPKGQAKGVTVTNYFNCSYWVSEKIAPQLTKAALVEAFGRIGINAYTDLRGNARASLIFHANNIKVHQSAKEVGKQNDKKIATTDTEEVPVDDLPF